MKLIRHSKSATATFTLSLLTLIVVLTTTDKAREMIQGYNSKLVDPSTTLSADHIGSKKAKGKTIKGGSSSSRTNNGERKEQGLLQLDTSSSSSSSFERRNRLIPFYFEHHSLPTTFDSPTLTNITTRGNDDNDNNNNDPSPSLDFLNVKPIFQCRDPSARAADDESKLPGRQQKLVFVHVFKTAGTTMRGLFKRYAQRCGVGWQLTIRCTGANETSILPSFHPTVIESAAAAANTSSTDNTNKKVKAPWWFNYNYQESCMAKKGIWRNGHSLRGPLKFNSDFLNANIDILGGHVELGVADYTWTDYQDIRYITFFRNAISKFVSGKMYNEQRTLHEHVQFIKTFVNDEVSKKKYDAKYQNYLLTPFQKAAMKRSSRHYNFEERANLIKQNIINYRIICGITERMPESLQILHKLIDHDDGARDIFEEWGMPTRNGTKSHQQHRSNVHYEKQQSNNTKTEIVTTSRVVEELQKDTDFFEKLKEYTKYEQSITDFALEVHYQQHQSVLQTQQINVKKKKQKQKKRLRNKQ